MIPWAHYKMIKEDVTDSEIYYYEQVPLVKEKGVLIILPGWSYIADAWSSVLLTNTYLNNYYRVLIILNRGYKNEYYKNNTLNRFTTDIYDFIKRKELTNITMLGHSIGCVYIWNMIFLFGEERFKNYIIVDEPPILLKELSNDDKMGAIYDKQSLTKVVHLLNDNKKDADEYKTSFTKKLFSDSFNKSHPEIIKRVAKGTLEFNNNVLADILENTVSIHNMVKLFSKNKIMKPALLIGGKESVIPEKSIRYQARFYENPTVYIFTKGSSHSMFIENYKTFNMVMNRFLKGDKKTKKRGMRSSKRRTRRAGAFL